MLRKLLRKSKRTLYRKHAKWKLACKGRPTKTAVASAYGIWLHPNQGDVTFKMYIDGDYGAFYAHYLKSVERPFVFLDIGANQGLYSILAAKNEKCLGVLAFEPVAKTANFLTLNLALNDCKNVDVHIKAISDFNGVAPIYLSEIHSGAATLQSNILASPKTAEVEVIDANTLNTLVPPNDDVMIVKIDVEGGELTVLKQLFKTTFAARLVSIFYECDERWVLPLDLQTLLIENGFAHFHKVGKGSQYDVLATRVSATAEGGLLNSDLVSIYLPTFNRCELLRRAVYSVLSQTYLNWELIIVDDRSTDGTREFLETVQKLDPRVKCVFKTDTGEVAGVQVSRNIAINMAKGQYITGLDDDDFFHPERIAKLKAAYRTDLSFVSSNYFRFSKGRTTINSKLARRITLKPLAIRNFVGNQVFTETKKLIAAGLFDEKMISSQDLDLWFRLIKMFGPAQRIVDHLYYYDAGHDANRISEGKTRTDGDSQLLVKHADIITGQAKKFKTDNLSVTEFGLHQGIFHSLRTYGFAVTFERVRTKYDLG